ncbi:MAG TPA: hypothetical protein VFR85_04905 [Anaeromyxobacteraceae bacterium]|nr:hypothetical protein [Anaeromyxobacteraceae bacterium]
MSSGDLHPAWRGFRRDQRILIAFWGLALVLLGLQLFGVWPRVVVVLFIFWLLAGAVPFVRVLRFHCPSCGQPWQLNAFSRRCRTCGLGLYQDPPPHPLGSGSR